LELRQRIEQQKSADRRGLYDPSLACGAIEQAARPARAQQPASERRRQGVGDLLRARMKEFGDLEDLPVLDLYLFAHARKAARTNLELGDADGVLVSHRQRELPRGFREQRTRTVAVLPFDLLKAGEPREELPRVAQVLKFGKPLDRGKHDGARIPIKVARG